MLDASACDQYHHASFFEYGLLGIENILTVMIRLFYLFILGVALSDAFSSQFSVYQLLRQAQVLNPETGRYEPALEEYSERDKTLCVLLPQLGDFDCGEYLEQLVAVEPELEAASIDLKVISIGNAVSARKFSEFIGLDISKLRVSPDASVHYSLNLHQGPNWNLSVPAFLPKTVESRLNAWTNYMAMCAGISAEGTLQEIFRGYVGDKAAPERLRKDSVVRAGPIKITGTRKVNIGPNIEYEQSWKDEDGYQRPVELATVRLRNMVEVLSNWNEYVPDDAHLAVRGATFILDNKSGNVEYEWRTPGVLTYSATMRRPLMFLEKYIGTEKAMNPLGLGDKARERWNTNSDLGIL